MMRPPQVGPMHAPRVRRAAPWVVAGLLGLLALGLALGVRPRIAQARAALLQAQVAWLEERQNAPAVVVERDTRERLRASLPAVPAAAQAAAELAPLVPLARDRQGWRMQPEAIEPGLRRERWLIPLEAGYPALKAALAGLFNRHPHAALDHLRLQAAADAPARLRGEVGISLYYRREP